ncbi:MULTISPECIES: AEC family transporter [unclassified Pseudomonas]|uniref:AEC family transporter n=1 Tax=unclassified Pseudomonas TaxID=196821 RepID=UPI0025808499|nr:MULTISPECIES: AEC family transporter [unclassified Pseudomonas]
MTTILLALWPLFALIVAGYWMRQKGFPGDAFWPAADRLNYFILFPSLLFNNLATAPLDDPALAHLALAAMTGLGALWIALLLARRFYHWPAERFGVIAQGTLRFNTYLGLATVGSLLGKSGLGQAALLLALMVPTVNVMSVWALKAERGARLGELLLPVLRNPLILACAAGALVNLLGWGLPFGTDRLLGLLAATSLPLGLFCVGAALKLQQIAGEWRAIGTMTLFRLLACPLLAGLIAYLLGLPPHERLLLVLFFSLPTAPTAYALTRQLGGDSALMAGVITLQTLVAAFTLPLVISLLGGSLPQGS